MVFLTLLCRFRPAHGFGPQAIDEISTGVGNVLARCDGVVIIGGDHTISYPSLKVNASPAGLLALYHFAPCHPPPSFRTLPIFHWASLRRT